MHHGSGPQNVQRQLQRSKSTTGSEAEDHQKQQTMAVTQQQAAANHPQSTVTTFASGASPSGPQSPNYQIIMSRSPVTGQNMNITLQNVSQMVTGNQQITLTPLPLQNPGSPGFQHTAPQWRFEPAPSYIQVTSPLPQSPTQHSPVPLQRPGAPVTGLGLCGQSPTRFVDAGMLVRQISLGSPPGSGHFVYQEGTGLTQLTPTTAGQVQLSSPGVPGSVRERSLSQPHSQTGGTIHHLGPQSPVASGTVLPTLGSPGHITTSNLPPQISSIIQGQLARPMIFEKTSQGMVTGVGTAATVSFSMPSTIPPSSPSLINPPQGIPNTPLTPTGMCLGSVKKQIPKKLEEIAPSNPEVAQLRKQCLEHHTKKMEGLKEVFKDYLIELFFLQHLQGNMMDYLAFKKKPCVPLFTYLRQNDLDLEEEEEEEEQSEVINDEVKVVTGKDGQAGTPVAIATQLPPNVSAAFSSQQQFQVHQGSVGSMTNSGDMDPFKRQQAMAQADQAKRSRIEVGRHGMIFQHPGSLGSPGVPLQQLMPTAQGGMPPNPQTVQIPGQKQNQPQYDPSKGPPVQNAASLHTPPPQLPGRLPQGTLPMAVLPMALSQQSLLVDSSAQAANQLQVKVQGAGQIMAPVNPHTQLQAHFLTSHTVALTRPGADSNQPGQRIMTNSLTNPSMSPAPLNAPNSLSSPHTIGPLRPNINPATQSKLAGPNGTSTVKMGGFGQGSGMQSSEGSSHDKQAEQAKLESQVHQRISELRKEGQWSASRLPKLMESSRPKSHWDYLLEEMQWMAADFAQERRWKMAAAKKLVRTCSRYHDEQKKLEEGSKKEEELRLRHIASTISREVEFFWSNIEQVVEIKLRFQIYEKRLKTLSLQREPNISTKKRKSSTSLAEEVQDEESTIEEQEAMEVTADQKADDRFLPITFVFYAGAYADNFDWPQPSPQSDEDEMESSLDTPHEAVVIDSLLSVDQYRGSEKTSPPGADGKPKKDIAEVAASTELILPKGSARTTTSGRSQAPFLLHGSLREYQQIGVDWLASLHKKHLNGILADETGLGKTVQTVAYLAHLACQEGIWGPHLVVVRTCKILSWEMEFKRWCPGLKILLYLGNRQERRAKRMWWAETNSFHVCVTSYKLLLKDQSHFLRRRWKHLVLDEVQLIKNMSEKHWETIFALKSQQRILLINTPLQNTLKELWTMIHFLLPGITRPYTDFPVKPGTDQNQDYCHKLVIRLHRPYFVIRALLLNIKFTYPLSECLVLCLLSALRAQEALKTGHFVSVLQVLMQLQRICNHPDLVNIRETSSSYVCSSLQYNTPSLVLGALQEDQRTSLDLSLFDLISNENRLTRYEMEEVLPKLKVTRQLIEEIHSAPDPPARPKPCKIKPMRLFQPVQYGTKPEGRLVPMTNTVGQQRPPATTITPPTTTATTTSTAPQPARTTTTTQGGDVLKIAQLASIAGSQNRISQPETPVTLQFQGNKFTLSPSQLRQLTTGQPLQLQGTLGNILQIVSAPGQQILRPQGSMVMQTVPQAAPVSNSSTRSGTPPPTGPAQQGKPATFNCEYQDNEERGRHLKERLSRLFSANERRCDRSVLYGADLLQVCSVTPGAPHSALSPRGWRWVGRDSCLRAQRTPVATTTHLQSALRSSTNRQDASSSLVSRLSCVVPAAVARPPYLYAANPPAPYSLEQKLISRRLQEAAAPHSTEIHSMASGLQFPDLQLMQMDSGKLEALAILLQKLRSENRRVLIFTQMVKMLDILEAFLDHRQLTYIRVDESLITEERQEHMKTFNRNRQVFCSILTNRCCSAVGTVFDADTIIFYDTDLNPSMDARTQEWCDKIGRSKDIHIYRLESGNSIEEKLLKNGTKDLIREVAAQGTDYTLAFLTQRTIQDLFEVEAGSGEKVEEFVVLHQEPSPSEAISPRVARPYIQALHSISLDAPPPEQQEEDDLEKELQVKEEPSQLEELNAVMDQLTPIEKYALQFLEYLHVSEDELVAKERLLCAKRGWEMQHLQKLKAQDEERMIIEEEEDLFTYTREDAYNMEYVFDGEDGQSEIMPLWTPPTPPQDDNDIYIDSVICLMYDSAPMPESKLPPVYIRKEHKRLKMDPSAAGRKKKKGHGETVIPPRSLFEKASMLKVRREGKDQKKNFSLKQQAPFAKPLPSLVKPAMEAGQDNPEWLISEDWALLQAMKQLLELPLNLTIVSPAHTPNWDLVSDVVNSCSRIYRSPKQCRNRYENVIIPREEGKLVYEANPKKKTKSIYKSKNSRPLRTCQIYTQDDNATHIQLYNSRFELMKIIASKRSPPIKPLLGMNPFQKNPKHASVLAESGIGYDKPLPPIQVASQRAERIAKEKKALAEQQRAQQLAQQAGAPQAVAGAAQPQAGAPAAGQAQAPGVLQAPAAVGAMALPNTAVLVRMGKTLEFSMSNQVVLSSVGGNLIVNTVAGVPPSPFQANKRLVSPGQVIPGTLSPASAAGAQVVHSQQRAVPATAAPGEVVAIATGQGVRAVTPVTASAVVTTTLTPVQSQTRSLVTPGMQLPQGKPITQAHLHMLRQQQLQQQQQQAASPQGIKAVGKPQELLKIHKQKLQMAQQQPGAGQQPVQVQPANPQAAQANPQLATIAAGPRAGAVLAGTTVANLQVARLTRLPTQGQIQAQPGQTAQVTLTKPPVVSVPSVVSSAGVTTLPVTMAGISVAIGQAQKTGGPVLTPPFPQMQVQQLLQMKKQQVAVQAAAALQKAVQPGQASVQQKQMTVPTTQQQKVTYAATTQLQPSIKTQFFTTSIAQAGKPTGAQQIQVAKLPQIVQGQSTVANIQQIVSSPQQIQPQPVALTQTTSSAQPQVQMIPAGTATAQVVQQKLLQQQVVTAAASPQIQTPPPHSPAQQAPVSAAAESPVQQQPAKGQARGGAMRGKTQAKPSGGSS
uniref:E1A binding protein p400 n=1 Tax=Oncorhynchus kisutch TaxID=8019 RepID=A0A8C7CRB6_ONCKI